VVAGRLSEGAAPRCQNAARPLGDPNPPGWVALLWSDSTLGDSGPMFRHIFEMYVEAQLALKLPEGDVVILVNGWRRTVDRAENNPCRWCLAPVPATLQSRFEPNRTALSPIKVHLRKSEPEPLKRSGGQFVTSAIQSSLWNTETRTLSQAVVRPSVRCSSSWPEGPAVRYYRSTCNIGVDAAKPFYSRELP
jgi:hypothetical protein